jgi:hypothetical protein
MTKRPSRSTDDFPGRLSRFRLLRLEPVFRRLMTRRGCSDTWRRKPRAGHRTGHTKLARNAATFALLRDSVLGRFR